ncbi:MAG TPA: CBS domain-containing protein [Longimicrobiales bacterium]|nr:CBS domain-containing protein [Longimicrobiales bacterium]
MLTVRDVMSAAVVTISPDATARQLARLLADEEISGVPVVDDNGALMGVVSATDLVRLAAEDADVHVASSALPSDRAVFPDPDGDEEPDPDPYGFFLPEDSPFSGERLLDEFTESKLDAVLVSEIMTPVAFSVGPDDSVKELADFLVRGRIHRAVVVVGERLQGIVSSADVLRAVAEGRLV